MVAFPYLRVTIFDIGDLVMKYLHVNSPAKLIKLRLYLQYGLAGQLLLYYEKNAASQSRQGCIVMNPELNVCEFYK